MERERLVALIDKMTFLSDSDRQEGKEAIDAIQQAANDWLAQIDEHQLKICKDSWTMMARRVGDVKLFQNIQLEQIESHSEKEKLQQDLAANTKVAVSGIVELAQAYFSHIQSEISTKELRKIHASLFSFLTLLTITQIAQENGGQAISEALEKVKADIAASRSKKAARTAPPKQNDSNITGYIFIGITLFIFGGLLFWIKSKKKNKKRAQDEKASEQSGTTSQLASDQPVLRSINITALATPECHQQPVKTPQASDYAATFHHPRDGKKRNCNSINLDVHRHSYAEKPQKVLLPQFFLIHLPERIFPSTFAVPGKAINRSHMLSPDM